MSRPLLLGIDEGTSAVKAIAYDLDLRPVAGHERRVATSQPHPGWVEQDADEVLEAVVDAVAAVLQEVVTLGGEVVACGLDHQGESVLAWDAATGRPLSPIVVWQDRRALEVLDRLSPDAAAEVSRRSGLPVDPYFSAGKLAWLLERGLPHGARLGTVDAFLTDRLGGIYATDPSTASRTQLSDVAAGAGQWDPWLCACFGVPVDVLPAIEDSLGELGTLSHPRWPVALPLRARVVDQQAALAGAGCVVPGRVKATYGTGVFVLAHAGDVPPASGGALLPTVAWRHGAVTEFALDGGVFSAGSLLEWLARDMGLAPDVPALAALAREVPDAGGVRVLPALAGLGAPWWQPSARAAVAGLTGASRPAHVAHAALEGVAWRVADILEVIAEHAPVEVLRVDGGLTRSPLLLELQADAAGVAVEAGEDATASGAAALAAVGAGLWPSTRAIAERVPAGDRTTPRTDAAWRTEGHEAWRSFVRAAGAL